MLERLFPKNYGFYDLFERHAAITLTCVKTMHQALTNLDDNTSYIKRIEELEHECDSVAHLTVDLVRRTFIAPFDRDEIMSLISAMDDVIDYVEAAAHRLVLFEIKEVPPQVIKLSETLIKAQEEVVILVDTLRKMNTKPEISTHYTAVKDLEREADRINREGIANLFKLYADNPLMVIKLKEVLEIMESAMDKCQDVANVIEGIFIEHVG